MREWTTPNINRLVWIKESRDEKRRRRRSPRCRTDSLPPSNIQLKWTAGKVNIRLYTWTCPVSRVNKPLDPAYGPHIMSAPCQLRRRSKICGLSRCHECTSSPRVTKQCCTR